MLRHLRQRHPNALSITVDEFTKLLQAIFPRGAIPPRLGLAVSGGVDSMALSHLLYLLQHSRGPGSIPDPQITAYIVDHLSRPTSTDEANSVATYLRDHYGFSTHILSLPPAKSPTHPTANPNTFEATARWHRYNLLAHACLGNGTKYLMLAHHKDDQAETVFMRVISGTGHAGLAAMKAIAPIPESIAVKGAQGLKLVRPFLGVGKERLVETCVQQDVKWWEDETNQDRTLTRRNAVRWLLGEHGGKLPRAISREGLIGLAEKVAKRVEWDDWEVRKRMIKYGGVKVEIVPFSGEAEIEIPRKLEEEEVWWSGKGRETALARMVGKIIELVSPVEKVDAKVIREIVLPRLFKPEETAPFTAGGLKWTPEHRAVSFSKRKKDKDKDKPSESDIQELLRAVEGLPEGYGDMVKWHLSRQPPIATQPAPVLTLLSASKSNPEYGDTRDWHLFDNRFFFRRTVTPGSPPPWRPRPPIKIRLLKQSEVNSSRNAVLDMYSDVYPFLPVPPPVWLPNPKLGRNAIAGILNKAFAKVKGQAKFTIPIAVMEEIQGKGEDREVTEVVVGFPSLGVWKGGTFTPGEKVECVFRGEDEKEDGDNWWSKDGQEGMKVVYNRPEMEMAKQGGRIKPGAIRLARWAL